MRRISKMKINETTDIVGHTTAMTAFCFDFQRTVTTRCTGMPAPGGDNPKKSALTLGEIKGKVKRRIGSKVRINLWESQGREGGTFRSSAAEAQPKTKTKTRP